LDLGSKRKKRVKNGHIKNGPPNGNFQKSISYKYQEFGTEVGTGDTFENCWHISGI
jgi:hypothetical protein